MSGIIGKCGLLEVAFAYDAPVKKMTIHVLQARDIPATDRGRPQYTQVIDWIYKKFCRIIL